MSNAKLSHSYDVIVHIVESVRQIILSLFDTKCNNADEEIKQETETTIDEIHQEQNQSIKHQRRRRHQVTASGRICKPPIRYCDLQYQ